MKILKWLLRVVLAILGLFMLGVVIEGIFPAGLETKSTRGAAALLFEDSHYELPEKVEISIDGVKAVFHRGDGSYEKLVDLLHNGRSQELLDKAGYPLEPSFPSGELVIRNYGITSRFPILRAGNNVNIYWIWLPKLTSPGHSRPLFTADPRVIEFIKASSGDHNGSSTGK